MRTLRRIVQITSLLVFFIFFLLATYPFHTRIPVDFFLRIDPLIQWTAILSSRSFYAIGFLSLLLIFLTIIFGRFFCGWICPLGTCIDFFDNTLRHKPKNGKYSPGTLGVYFKFGVLLFLFVTALFSLQLSGYVDPISIMTRTTTTVLYPIFVFLIEGVFRILEWIPFLASPIQKFETFLQSFLLPISPSVFRGSFLIGILFLGILLLGTLQKRFWCRHVCPLGALLGLFSKFRLYHRSVSEKCTACGICYQNCRMEAIGKDFKSTQYTECINCMDCEAVCPVGAIQFGFSKKGKPAKVDLTRRKVLSAGASGLFAVALFKTSLIHPVQKAKAVRPPGALVEDQFLDRCIRCGECIRICSTSGQGLQYAGLETGWSGLATPILLPPLGYCEYNCNLCGQVCPTGAIRSLSLEEKHGVKMGTAHFDKTRCIPWYYGENCMVCEEHCPVPEKAIKFREERIVTIDGKEAVVMLPYVVEELCVGCGICVVRCPLEGEKGIFLTNAGERRFFAKG